MNMPKKGRQRRASRCLLHQASVCCEPSIVQDTVMSLKGTLILKITDLQDWREQVSTNRNFESLAKTKIKIE